MRELGEVLRELQHEPHQDLCEVLRELREELSYYLVNLCHVMDQRPRVEEEQLLF
jgi:NTP pyrophosphatase (non-canonical NTP hydrolase)